MTIPKNTIPYGVGNFEEIRESNYHIVDKTDFLPLLENYKVPVFLRPRRFGKTLWCSLLECYYDINRKNKFDALFGNLKISASPTDLKNTCMVLRFNFSTVTVKSDLSVLEDNFNSVNYPVLDSFLHIYRAYFQENIQLDETIPLASSLAKIFQYIQKHQLPPIYIIIDEYDNFTNQLIISGKDDLYYHLTTAREDGDSFFRTFFKVIKAGVESQSVGKVFITGVLPITMDDLTSGFNIAEIITLKEDFHNMLGFTQVEVDHYLNAVIRENQLSTENLPIIQELIKNFYNGYQFDVEAEEKLYNSTIITYFLKNLVTSKGKIPKDLIDPNLKTDVNWIRRLSSEETGALELTETLMRDGKLPYDDAMIKEKFNMRTFFEKDFYPVSLFYLGMQTLKDDFYMSFPNQTMRQIFAEYHNELSRIEVSKGYTSYFEQFLKDMDLIQLFSGYWKTYIGQIPAQAFDKVNENFIRTTFFELCSRYISRYFTFGIEVNHPSGRSDWEMLGKFHTQYANQMWLIEFKYFTRSDSSKWSQKINAPQQSDIDQVNRYAQDILNKFPNYHIRKYVCYVFGNKDFNMFELSE